MSSKSLILPSKANPALLVLLLVVGLVARRLRSVCVLAVVLKKTEIIHSPTLLNWDVICDQQGNLQLAAFFVARLDGLGTRWALFSETASREGLSEK